MAKALTARSGALWAQLAGPTSPVYFLGCHDLGDITIPTRGGIELMQCFSPTGQGWDTIGVKESAPGLVTFSIDNLMSKARDLLEDVACPITLYALQRDCGRPDAFDNYVRGIAIENVYVTNHKYAGLVKRMEEAELTHSVDMEATPDDIYKIQQLTIGDRLWPASWACQTSRSIQTPAASPTAAERLTAAIWLSPARLRRRASPCPTRRLTAARPGPRRASPAWWLQ